MCAGEKLSFSFTVQVVSETQSNKTISSCNQGIAPSLKGNQTELKESNFEYEDNEWDLGKNIYICSDCLTIIDTNQNIFV